MLAMHYKRRLIFATDLTLVVLKGVENIQISVALECARIKCLIYIKNKMYHTQNVY